MGRSRESDRRQALRLRVRACEALGDLDAAQAAQQQLAALDVPSSDMR